MPTVAVSERLAFSLRALGAPGEAWLAGLPGLLAAGRGWRPVPDDGRLPTGAEAARWHASFISSAWEDLARPCPETAVNLAVRCAAAREAAFDPSRKVLIHGDVHAVNALQVPGPVAGGMGFRLVDPGGLMSEPAHDLGVIQARGVQGWLDELAAGEPRQALEMVTGSCWRAGRLTGTDPEAVWQWAFIEMVSTGLLVLRLGRQEEAETFLGVAGKLAAAATKGQPGQGRHAGLVGPARVTGELRAVRQSGRPSLAHDEVRPATLFLMVGLPGAGKTTRAQELAAEYRALRLTPDEWMIQLFGESTAGRKRDILEGRLIVVALQTLRLGTNVVLDFGLWGRDERSALRWLATAAGASCQVVYLPVDRDVQQARIAHRQATAPHTTFPMTEADIDR